MRNNQKVCLSVQQSESLSPTQLSSQENNNNNNNNNIFPGEIVCIRNISINTLRKGVGDDDDDDNNNNNNQLCLPLFCNYSTIYMSYIKTKSSR